MRRPTAHARGYTTEWMRERSSFLAEHPYCLGCAAVGRLTAATVVDHVIPHQGDRSKFWDALQPACAWHHNSIKPILERQWRAGKLADAALRLDSLAAVALTKARHRPAVGLDGFAIEGT